MGTVKLKQLPACDVCKSLNLPKPNPATADSPLQFDAGVRWGYSCDHHEFLRLLPITLLVEES